MLTLYRYKPAGLFENEIFWKTTKEPMKILLEQGTVKAVALNNKLKLSFYVHVL